MSGAPDGTGPKIPTDVIHIIVDMTVDNFEIENLDPAHRDQRRLEREFYCKVLLNLRATCRGLCDIISRRVFHTLKLTHTVKSITGFLDMVQSPWVRPYVQAVKYQYWDPEPHRHEDISSEDISERESSAEIRQILSRALSRVHEFPSLRSLSIRFGEAAPRPTELVRIRDDLSAILDALVSLGKTPLPTRTLRSLYLTRLPPIHLAQYDDPAFLALRANLELFEVHAAGSDAWSPIPPTTRLPPQLVSPCEPFFYDTLPHRILPPPSPATGLENLQALALCFSDPIGVFFITYSYAELRFPRLRALRLQHVQFSIAGDAERFVVQHAETLVELQLLHCQIAVEDGGQQEIDGAEAAMAAMQLAEEVEFPPPDDNDGWPPVPQPWSDIYFEFERKLDRLVFLDVQDAWWMSFPDRYVTYTPRDTMVFLEKGREEDTLALQSFVGVVKGRAEKLVIKYKPIFPLREENEIICDC